MKIAVLIPAYNAASFVGDAIASVLQQRDAARFDIIVVDDGSTDNTAAIVTALAAEAPEVRLIRTSNGGVSQARNVALDAVQPDTDLLTMLDADDMSPAGRFARDIKRFEADPALGFLYGVTRMFRDVGADRLVPDPDGRFVDVRGVQLGAGLLRAALAKKVGHFDETVRHGEDTDFLFRLFDLHPKIELTDDVCVYYRRHGNNVTNDRNSVLSGLSRVLAARLKRSRQGIPVSPVPPGFFAGMDKLKDINWAGMGE